MHSMPDEVPRGRECVYRLADDSKKIRDVQRARTKTEEYGVEPTPALFGSPQWWEAVQDGALPTGWVHGSIDRPIWSGMNDFPEVEIQDASGKISTWIRYGDVTQYSKGRARPVL